MAITRTTFRILQRTHTGPEALKLAIQALREVLPNSLVDCVQLNRTKFPINLSRYPTQIWHQLLLKREWHDKLIYHLANSLDEGDHVRRMARQAEFAAMVTAPDTRVVLFGSMLFESEGTPVMLEEAGMPMAHAFGCDLVVDAYTEFVKQVARTKAPGEEHARQRAMYGQITLADQL